MRYLVLCCDYDGTIAHNGRVDAPTIAALEKLRESGRRLVMVTGRRMDDLQTVFERLDLFECIVAENGAVLYFPARREERVLAEAPPARFVDALRARGVQPLELGRCIVATWEPHQEAALQAIHECGLDLQVIFNKGAVMILPAGVTKGSGLEAALNELNISMHNAVGVGDAENDHAFLRICECSAAVANALPAVKEKVDIQLDGDHGAGVAQLIEEMIADDLASREAALVRHDILLGVDERGEAVRLSPWRVSALVVGTSGGGKSTVAVGLVERLLAAGYCFCVIDPEGDYDNVESTLVLGGPNHAPTPDECEQALRRANGNLVINLLAVKFKDRPAFFNSLFARIRDVRANTGRPHCLIVDEAHHVLPANSRPVDIASPEQLEGVVLISVAPSQVAAPVVKSVATLVALGEKPQEMLEEFTRSNGVAAPASPVATLAPGDALVWSRGESQPPRLVRLEPNRTERRRHLRKYAEGSLPEDRSFYFRGPEGKLNLRAHNLILFADLADGVDDDTWVHHVRRGEISRWLRTAIKDETLADQVARIEHDDNLDPVASRRRVRELIEERYTLPG